MASEAVGLCSATGTSTGNFSIARRIVKMEIRRQDKRHGERENEAKYSFEVTIPGPS